MAADETIRLGPVRYNRNKGTLTYLRTTQLQPRHNLILGMFVDRVGKDDSVVSKFEAHGALHKAGYQVSEATFRAIVHGLTDYAREIHAGAILHFKRAPKTGYYLEILPENTAGSFALLLDGMILNSASELIHGFVSEERGEQCGTLYKSAVEDFGFAVVYGSEISSLWLPHSEVIQDKELPVELSQADQAGHLLAKLRDGVYRQGMIKQQLRYGRVLDKRIARDRVREYLRSFVEALRIPSVRGICKEWMQREAQVYLGEDPALFDPKVNPRDLPFRAKYYDHPFIAEVSEILGTDTLKTLVGFLPTAPGIDLRKKRADRYSPTTLREFALCLVMTHFTVMYEYETMAASADALALTTPLRGWIKKRWYAEHPLLRDDFLKDIMVRSALHQALAETQDANDRGALVSRLLWIRDLEENKLIRAKLGEYCVLRKSGDKKRYPRCGANPR